MNSELRNLFTSIDLFSLKPRLSIKNKDYYQTLYGGILSSIYILIILAYAINVLVDISKRNNDNLVTSIVIYNETAKGTDMVYGKDLTLMFSLVDSNFIPMDFSKFQIFNFSVFNNYWELDDKETVKNYKLQNQIDLIPCNLSYYSNFNERYRGLLKDRMFCLNLAPFLFNNSSFSLGGNILTQDGQYNPGISVRPRDDIINDVDKLNQFHNYLKTLGGIIVFSKYQGTNLSDPNYPQNEFLIWNFFSFDQPKLETEISLKLQNVQIKKDLSLFPGSVNTSENLTLNDISIHNSPNDYFELKVFIKLSNLYSNLKITAPKYDFYLNKVIVISLTLYCLLNFIIHLVIGDHYLHYLVDKFVKVLLIEQKGEINAITQEDIKRVMDTQNKQNQKENYNYETKKIDFNRLKFNQRIIDDSRQIDEDAQKIEDLQEKSYNKEIIIDLKREECIIQGEESEPETERKILESHNQNFNPTQRKKLHGIEIKYDWHQQEYKLLASSYYDELLIERKKIKGEKMIRYNYFKFCCCKEKYKLRIDLLKLYMKSISTLLSFENIIQSLSEVTKMKRVFFNDYQFEIFSSFFVNNYLPNEAGDIQNIRKDDNKEYLIQLTAPVNEYFECFKNKQLLEMMNQEIIYCTRKIERD